MNITLKMLVFSKYKNITSFASSLGWKRNKVSRIINGVQDPTTREITKMASKLDINNADLFMSIFFSSMSTMWTAT